MISFEPIAFFTFITIVIRLALPRKLTIAVKIAFNRKG